MSEIYLLGSRGEIYLYLRPFLYSSDIDPGKRVGVDEKRDKVIKRGEVKKQKLSKLSKNGVAKYCVSVSAVRTLYVVGTQK